jgi:hypothetical protein
MKILRKVGTVKKSDVRINEKFGNTDVAVLKDEDSEKVEISWFSSGSDRSIKNAEDHVKNVLAAIKRAKELEKSK